MISGFEAGVKKFQECLRANRSPERILWIQPEDILLTGKRLFYVKILAPESRELAARQVYEIGAERGLGVLFGTICEVDGTTCCYVWIPANEDEAEAALMPADLKMSIKTDKVPTIAIRSRLFWWFLKLRFRHSQTHKGFLFHLT